MHDKFKLKVNIYEEFYAFTWLWF
ncbi:hypothetical protein XAP6164_5910002 [Xanthomonas phaseoli pv. phaseoli]|nr:hypothetical protein XAP6164_5910002 [Xanthomonas phaseoli pv. phaseoli]